MRPARVQMIVAVVLVIVGVLASATPARANARFVPSAQVAAMLRAKQVMVGYGDGDMRWGNTITRAEAVKLLLAAIGEVAPSLTRAPMAFSDVSRTHWAFSHITMAAEMGLVRGRPGNLFDPDQGVTMAEFMVMVTRVYVGLGSEAEIADPRVQIEPAWAASEIAGWPDLVQLVAEGSELIQLDYPASRGEVGSLAGRMMNRLGLSHDVSGVLVEYVANSRLVVSLEDGAPPVEIPTAGGVIWFSEDGTVLPSILVGRKVYMILDEEGAACVVLGQLR